VISRSRRLNQSNRIKGKRNVLIDHSIPYLKNNPESKGSGRNGRNPFRRRLLGSEDKKKDSFSQRGGRGNMRGNIHGQPNDKLP